MRFKERQQLVEYKLNELRRKPFFTIAMWLIYALFNTVLLGLVYKGVKEEVFLLTAMSGGLFLYNLYVVFIDKVLIKKG